MKTLKIFLITAFILLLIALGAGVYVWYKVQQLYADPEVFTPSETPGEMASEEKDTGEGDTASESVDPVPDETVVIPAESMTVEQKETLEDFGIDPDRLVVTEETIECAEKKLGVERYKEIIAGATPSPLESVTLLSCI